MTCFTEVNRTDLVPDRLHGRGALNQLGSRGVQSFKREDDNIAVAGLKARTVP